jgi:hypothetical protein
MPRGAGEGAGVLIGMPGIGAIVGSAATTGAAHVAINAAASNKQERSNATSGCSAYYGR